MRVPHPSFALLPPVYCVLLLSLAQVPPNKTDQVQPIDRGLGRHIKIYMGQEEDAWLEDDENLQMWENNELTTGDRRILIAQWYCKAYHKALESEAKRKYFEHAGVLHRIAHSPSHHTQPIALRTAHRIV